MPEQNNSQALAAIEGLLAGCPRAEFRARLRKDLERSIVMPRVMQKTASVVEAVRGARPGFTAVTPYVRVPDVEPWIEFVKRVFGAEETQRSTRGGRVHCEMRIGDSMVMIGGGTSQSAAQAPIKPRLCAFHIHIPDIEAAHQRALVAGGEELGPPRDMPYGERASGVKDPAGNYWYVATYLGQGAEYLEQRLGTVTPHRYVQRQPGKGAPEFIDFMKAAFGARQEFRTDSPEGLIMHAVVRINGAAIELGEGTDVGFSAPTGFVLYVDDCDALYKQALAAGAKSLQAPADMPYGDRMGGVEDPWGNEWFISTHLGQ